MRENVHGPLVGVKQLLGAPSGLLPAVLLGCGGAAAIGPAGSLPGAEWSSEPRTVVAEFLDAANRRDHWAMASRFGTAEGPVGERPGALGCALRRVGSWLGIGHRCASDAEVEVRMDLIAAALAHESYSVVREERVVGKGRPAWLVEVELAAAGRLVAVPFLAILSSGERWLVERVELKGLM